MMGKWAGAVCILCASWGMGVWLAAQWKGRLKALEELRRMVYFLKGEITYGHEVLEEALRRVGRRGVSLRARRRGLPGDRARALRESGMGFF